MSLLQISRHTVRFFPSKIGSTAQATCVTAVRYNSHRTSIVTTNRKVYKRTYPVILVQSDGSSFTIRYKQPQRILVMPENLALLTANEKYDRYRRIDPPKRVVVEQYDDEGYDETKYKYIEKMRK